MIEEIISEIKKNLSKSNYDRIVNKIKNKELVYTSFDGDDMRYIQDMERFCLKDNLIPINPESALGYYVSTVTHGNKKVPVMEDCIALSLLCENFYVFNYKNHELPEGVIAEMIYWGNIKKSSIKIVEYNDDYSGFNPCSKKDLGLKQLNCLELDADYTESMKKKLFLKMDKQNSVYSYIVANFNNFKHLDWIRAYCYKNKICPISPQNILQYTLYSNFYKNNLEYISGRLKLLEKSDTLLFFTNTSNLRKEIDRLDIYSKVELLYWYENKDRSKINVIDWANINVPKYKNKNWAITENEREL